MEQNILVTGASGNVGKEVVKALQSTLFDTNIRIATRKRDEMEQQSAQTESVYLDFNDPSTFKSAVAGCTSLFLLRPPAISNTKETLNRLVDTARECGVERIVFLSVAGAADNKLVPHHAVEKHLRSGPEDWIILRPGFFAQNLASAYRDDILRDDRIYVPAGDGKVAFVDLRDVGLVAARALTSLSENSCQTHTLTGPEAYTFYEVAEALSKNLERDISYVPASVPGYLYHLIFRKKITLMQAVVQTILHTGLRFGQAEQTDSTLENLLNKEPNDVINYIEDHADIWRN